MSFSLGKHLFGRSSLLEFSYNRVVNVSISHVWCSLTQVDVIQTHLPDGMKIIQTDPGRYRIGMRIKVGFMSTDVNAEVRMINISELKNFDIEFSGSAMGAGVIGSGTSSVSNKYEKKTVTVFNLSSAIETSGLLRSVSNEKLEKAVSGFLDDFFSSVEDGSVT